MRRALVELVRTRRPVADDQERLDGYLRDVCPHHPAEVAVVVVAARAGVPGELAHASEGHGVDATVARLAARLHSEAGVDRELAQWAVETWAVALGRMPAVAPTVEVPVTSPTVEMPVSVPADTPAEVDLRAMVARPAMEPLDSDPPAAGVALLVVVALVVALAGGGEDEPAASPPGTAATSTASTLAPKPFPSDTVPLAAGTYTTSTFKPAMTMTVGEAWRVSNAETPEFFSINRTDGAVGAVNVVRLSRVFPSTATYRTIDEGTRAGATEAVPADVAAWLTANPNLTTSRPTPTSIPGVRGTQVEVTVRSGYDSALCGTGCVPLWPFEEPSLGFGFLGSGKRNTVHALDVGGEKVLVILVASTEQYPAFVREADRLLATLTFPR